MSNISQVQRQQFVGSSEVASLFSVDLNEMGQKAYETRYELWARKSGLVKRDFAGNNRTRWGTRMEGTIARGFAEDHGFKVRNARRYVLHPEVDRMGASPDYEIVSHPLGPAWAEIKAVDRLVYLSWPEVEEIDDRDFVAETGLPYLHKRREPPLRLQLQVQSQLACAPSKKWAVLVILVGGNELVPIPYPRVESSIQSIEEEVPAFWAEVDSGIAPPIDWSADHATVVRLHGYSDPDKFVDLSGDAEAFDLAQEHCEASRIRKEADEVQKITKAKLLERVGDASRARLMGGYSISSWNVSESDISYTRKGYRAARVNPPKET